MYKITCSKCGHDKIKVTWNTIVLHGKGIVERLECRCENCRYEFVMPTADDPANQQKAEAEVKANAT